MPLLLLAFLLVPVVELAAILAVGRQIGAPWTIAALIAISTAGAVLVRREGARAWRNFAAALGSGHVPAKEVADGALVLFGGALLLTPGFLSDVLGLLCLLPPTRVAFRGPLLRLVARRFVSQAVTEPHGSRTVWTRSRRGPASPGATPAPPRPASVIDGELDEPPGSGPPDAPG